MFKTEKYRYELKKMHTHSDCWHEMIKKNQLSRKEKTRNWGGGGGGGGAGAEIMH